ncbi:metalloregulator ArsR/SmtB family transcription factor [Yoonia sp. BS5-3]|uniref:ArsR/SmtB family transcription factor n=1 Tax=Yoonia phaeophyticola TaxID=3137369 RepID=A0ABZ2V1M1_9RHOB
MTYEDTITALADPTRRDIIDRLRSGPLAVGAIADGMPISRPAVSQHLRVLSDAGLLTVTPSGNRRLYAIAPDGVDELRRYLDTLWDDALAAFGRAAAEKAKESSK